MSEAIGTMANHHDAERILEMAKKLFPEYFELQKLESKMKQLQLERIKLSDRKLQGTNAYVSKVVESNQLRVLILDFENEQGKRVATILELHEHALERVAEARQAKEANIVKKGMPIVEERNCMKWESDTDAGDVKQVEDEFDAAIAKAEEQVQELSDKFTYEAMLHNTLVDGMKKFIGIAQLPKHEAALWVSKNSDNHNHFVFRPVDFYELKKCKVEAYGWMKAATLHFLELEENGGDQIGGTLMGLGDVRHDKANAASMEGETDVSDHDEAEPYDQPHPAWPVNFCTVCQKWGHVDEYCPEMFLEEDQPLYCDICHKEGHWEETCWVLHPQLKEQYLKEQREKAKKATCHNCGKTGHMRRFCHLLHK